MDEDGGDLVSSFSAAGADDERSLLGSPPEAPMTHATAERAAAVPVPAETPTRVPADPGVGSALSGTGPANHDTSQAAALEGQALPPPHVRTPDAVTPEGPGQPPPDVRAPDTAALEGPAHPAQGVPAPDTAATQAPPVPAPEIATVEPRAHPELDATGAPNANVPSPEPASDVATEAAAVPQAHPALEIGGQESKRSDDGDALLTAVNDAGPAHTETGPAERLSDDNVKDAPPPMADDVKDAPPPMADDVKDAPPPMTAVALSSATAAPDASRTPWTAPRSTELVLAPNEPDRIRVLLLAASQRPQWLPFASVRDALPQLKSLTPAVTAWVDVHTPTAEDLRLLGRLFGLHHVSVDGILGEVHTERIESFEDYDLLCIDLAVEMSSTRGDDDPSQEHRPITFVFLHSVLLSFHRGALADVRASMGEFAAGGGSAAPAAGAGAPPPAPTLFLHDLLRKFVAVCEASIKSAADETDQLQEQILEMPKSECADMLRRVSLVRQDLIALHRCLMSKRLILYEALTETSGAFVAADAHSLIAQLADEIDELAGDLGALKDEVSVIQSNYLSKISLDMAVTAQLTTERVKVFTIATALSIPISGVGTLLGMNIYFPNVIGFAPPDLPEAAPFWTAITVAVSMSLAIFLLSWRYNLLSFPHLFR